MILSNKIKLLVPLLVSIIHFGATKENSGSQVEFSEPKVARAPRSSVTYHAPANGKIKKNIDKDLFF